MLSAKNVKAKCKDELKALEAIIDKRDGNVEVVNKRMEVELESDVFNEEIKRAFWDCWIDKSPSPDGFTFGCNSSFIALIPNIPDANTVKDFRPISPIGSLYKIVAKILANRLVSVLGDIINEVQSAFIAGRQILDGLFILNEVLQCVSGFKAALDLREVRSSLTVAQQRSFNSSKALNKVNVRMWEDLCLGFILGTRCGGFIRKNTTLWVRVIKAIHGDDGKVEGYVKDGAKSCWLSIVNEINLLKNKGINLLDFMHVKLGNGDKIAFWEDIWIEGKVLKNRYPRIYSLETCKLITVGMKLAQTSLDSSFRRVPRGGVEQEQFDELSSLVHDVTLTPMSDR
nr:RNA-directed DNA polymerase, eukaryota, reverse transcriptase zinc-binding domain protein [Tanacetum cinerariifolium]